LNNKSRFWIMMGITILIVILFFIWVDWGQVWSILSSSNWQDILLASCCLLAGLVVYAIRWQMLLRGEASILKVFKAACTGHMLNILLPLRAGEPARIWMLSSTAGIPLAQVTSSIVVERLIEQLMRLMAVGGTIAFGVGLQLSPGTVAGGLAVLGLVFGGLLYLLKNRQRVLARWPIWLARIPKVKEDAARQGLANLLEGLASLSSTKILVMVILWSCGMWIFFWGYQYFTLAALNLHLETHQLLALTLGALALSPPSAPTQPGIYHASISVPLSVLALPAGTLPAYTLLLHLLQMVWMIGLGAWGLLSSQMHLGDLLGRPAGSTGALKG
jgi:uncharacterized protein (TIRG00374 family)